MTGGRLIDPTLSAASSRTSIPILRKVIEFIAYMFDAA